MTKVKNYSLDNDGTISMSVAEKRKQIKGIKNTRNTLLISSSYDAISSSLQWINLTNYFSLIPMFSSSAY